jgi:2-oxoglutarate ferredoxin oxidoreductase subunit delta
MTEKSNRKAKTCAKTTRKTPVKKTVAKKTKKKKQFDVTCYTDWCKACGICMAFCPQKILKPGKNGKPEVTDSDKCVGCRFCEIHCPDFAITVSDRKLKRRKTDV